MSFWSIASGRLAAGCEKRFRSTGWQHVRSATTLECRTHNVSAGCAVGSHVDRDRPVDCVQPCTMVGHFLDELSPVDQADAVRKIMDMAEMVKPIGLYLAFLFQGEATAHGDPVVT